MKSTLKKLAQHYQVKHSEMVSVLRQLDESVLTIAKNGRVTIFDVASFETAISQLPKVESLGIDIELIQPDNSTVVDAEIVEDEITTVSAQAIEAHQKNTNSLMEVAKFSAMSQARELGNIYRETIIQELSRVKQQTDKDILGILGK